MLRIRHKDVTVKPVEQDNVRYGAVTGELPPSEWSIDYDSLDQGRDDEWGGSARVAFTETAGTGQVRIARAADGHWSYLGTDILRIADDQPTMNLHEFTLAKPDAEFHRVVRHEAGHTLGFVHEHLRRELVVGLKMLSGRIPIRRGLTVVLGCFVLSSAGTIADALVAGVTKLPTQTSSEFVTALPCYTPPPSRPASYDPYDPYAGASVPPPETQ